MTSALRPRPANGGGGEGGEKEEEEEQSVRVRGQEGGEENKGEEALVKQVLNPHTPNQHWELFYQTNYEAYQINFSGRMFTFTPPELLIESVSYSQMVVLGRCSLTALPEW